MKVKINGSRIEASGNGCATSASVVLMTVRGRVVPVLIFDNDGGDKTSKALRTKLVRVIGPLHVKHPGRSVTVASYDGQRLGTLGRLPTLPTLPRL